MTKILNNPEHIAIIPDGNRRWAKKKGFMPWLGHFWGVKTFEKIFDAALELQIPYFTFWAGSFDNLTKRGQKEINYLFNLYAGNLAKAAKNKIIKNKSVKIQVLGRWNEICPAKTVEAIKNLEKITEQDNEHFLNLLIAYDGRHEMLEAVRKIAGSKNIKPEDINEKTFKENLWTKNLPPVDLVIRTGVENDPHNSAGFMMWDTAYSQYYFTKTLWPDFTAEEFKKAVLNFSNTERRIGK